MQEALLGSLVLRASLLVPPYVGFGFAGSK
jgi:hypothetical protein